MLKFCYRRRQERVRRDESDSGTELVRGMANRLLGLYLREVERE